VSLLDDLVSYWKLDEASGDALDAHGSNTLAAVNAPGSAAGKINTGRTFGGNASGQKFTIADNASLSMGDLDFTISAWVKLESKPAGNAMNVVAKRNLGGGNLEYWLRWLNTTDRFQFVVTPDGSTQTIVTADFLGPPSLGAWYHLVCWHDSAGDQILLQVNNGMVSHIAHGSGVFNGASDFWMGDSNTAEVWDGVLDEIGIWKRVLLPSERSALYNGGAGLPYSDFAPAPAGGRQASLIVGGRISA
jgi:hypothetical protein